jgi:hypothetical protein
LESGRRPQYFGKWKTTSIFGQNGRRPQFLGKMEDGINFSIFVNGRQLQFSQNERQLQYFAQLKTTSIFWKNVTQLQFFGNLTSIFTDDLNTFLIEDHLSFLLCNAGLANPSFS